MTEAGLGSRGREEGDTSPETAMDSGLLSSTPLYSCPERIVL